ncbi:helix-turn-helix transcriptional regulator [Oxalobacteraceae bacterium R-40]|uniref:Helix-turn-helix transcriptional regulator n=1 Tax=Keguizhuia sedimenti TaxID=3064264 RepID=A0ABU1BIS2_9BURK|nr:helix-turn-helix transcriptional regulator [Oxalobacteraceae bacterium R-40]
MVLKNFSNSVFELYEAALATTPNEFSMEIFRIVGKLISFDRAILSSAQADENPEASLTVDHTHAHNRAEQPVMECADNYVLDPVSDALAWNKVSGPCAIDCSDLYQLHRMETLNSFAIENNLQKMLLFGDFPARHYKQRWIALYRGTRDEFTKSDADVLQAIWNHISRTIELNLHQALNRLRKDGTELAVSLINSRGMIEVSNATFHEIMKLEWPLFNSGYLPLPVAHALVSNGRYRGKKIEITATQKFGYLACTAQSIPLFDLLAPAEMNVADRFAKGMTHSEIAAQLHISPHTVRNQIAQIYQKLGIHSKAELVRVMLAR